MLRRLLWLGADTSLSQLILPWTPGETAVCPAASISCPLPLQAVDSKPRYDLRHREAVMLAMTYHERPLVFVASITMNHFSKG